MQEEEDQFRDKEKFVTSSYKKKLIEDQKWNEEQQRLDAARDEDVTQASDMGGFYRGT